MSWTGRGSCAKNTPRGNGGKRGLALLAGVLAALVAALAATPAPVAHASERPTVTFVALGIPDATLIDGEDVWGSMASYCVTVSMDADYALVEERSTIFDSAGALTLDEHRGWDSAPGQDGGTMLYQRSFTMGASYHNELGVTVAYQRRGEDGSPVGEVLTTTHAYQRRVTVETRSPEVSLTTNGGRPQGHCHLSVDSVTVVAVVSMPFYEDGGVSLDETWKELSREEDETGIETRAFAKTFSEEGAHDVRVSARTRFGKEGGDSLGFTLDRTAPEVSVALGNDDALNGAYYVGSRAVTIRIEEALGFDPERVSVLVNDEPVSLDWSGEGAEHTAEVVFEKDGTHRLRVFCSDLAGNLGEGEDPYELVVDTTDPTLIVTCDNNDAGRESHYRDGRAFAIVAKDVNLDRDSLSVVKDGEVLEGVGWERGDDGSYEATVAFETDGVHSLLVTCGDLAGNFAAYESGEFVIDRVAPVIGVSWDSGGAAGEGAFFNAPRVATIDVRDENFDPDLITVDTNGTVGEWSDEDQSLSVAFDTDGECRLVVCGRDPAGNEADVYDSGSFFVDMTPPVLSVAFSDGDAHANRVDGIAYYADERFATITVVEKNFDPGRVTVSGGGRRGEWQDGENDAHTLEVTFPEAVAAHELRASVADRAGNGGVDAEGAPFEYESGVFVVDATRPEVTIELDKPPVQTFDGADFFAEAPAATVTVRDAHFDPESSLIEAEGATFGGWVEGGSEDGVTTWTSTATFVEGVGRTLEVTARDRSANRTTRAYQNNAVTGGATLVSPTFSVDLTAPVVTGASMSRPPSNSYGGNHLFFDSDAMMSVTVMDNIGLESFQVVKGGDTSGCYVAAHPETSVNVEGGVQYNVLIGLVEGRAFDSAIRVCAKDHAGNRRYWDLTPHGEEVYVSHVEGVSNPSVFDGVYPDSLLQDTVFPRLTLTGPAAGSYSSAPQTVSLSVEELNVPILQTYEPDQAVLTVRRVAGDASSAATTWSRSVSQLVHADDITHMLSEVLSADGRYTVSAQVRDPAGNLATAELPEFTVDRTAPVVEVVFDNDDVRNGKYYKAARTATITVTERNFDPALVAIETSGSVGDWSTSGDVHTVTVSFSTDGAYDLSVSGTDMAGNVMEAYRADEFVIDLQAPEIAFDGVEGQSAYNDSVRPVIVFTDEANFDAGGISYTIEGTKNGEVVYETFVSDQERGQTVTYADFAREPDVDDIYTISARVVDLAGNEAEESVTFSVNRFGSTFRVVDADSYARNDGYLLEGREVVVEEVNVSGVESERHAVTVTEGASVFQLALNEAPQPTGYTIETGVSEDSESSGWSVYTYRIPAGNFVRDGRYHVSVRSEDLAANINTSSNYYEREAGGTAAAEVDFILDTTDPVVTSLNIEDGAVYETGAYEGAFTVVENIGVREVEVLVDGEAVEVIDDGYGNYRFRIEAAPFTSRSLSITATDLAGRTGSAGADDFRVTADIFELRLPWAIAGIVAAVAAFGCLACLFAIRRKRDERGARS